MADAISIRACHCCGLAQRLPEAPPGARFACDRCGARLVHRASLRRSNTWTTAFALAALVLYPVAMTLPILEITRFGHRNASSILGGVAKLLGSGDWVVGLVVLLCSIVLPLAKLVALFFLTTDLMHVRHRARMYRLVEWTGRWGMLDVLLVTMLVAILKLGDMVDVAIGPAAFAFTAVVVLSLAASACFDPHRLWETEP